MGCPRCVRVIALAGLALFVTATSAFGRGNPTASTPHEVVALQGGRQLNFLATFSSEKDVEPHRALWKRVIDFIAGPPQFHHLVRPYGIAIDSQQRILVTDPGAAAVHVFDFKKKKYTCLIAGSHGEALRSPIGIAVDKQDNIYVTDSVLGRIFVYDARGKFRRYIGEAKGEGFFKRATGIAIDEQHDEIYVTDTLRDKIFVLNLGGQRLREFGTRGRNAGEFNMPTEVVVHGDELYVVDAMNFRVQIFDRQGNFKSQFGRVGDTVGSIFRPKGLGVDSEQNVYLVDGSFEDVQVFNPSGELLYFFGRTGTSLAEFQLPAGIAIDGDDRIYVADSYNHRVQKFEFVSAKRAVSGK